MDFPSIEQDVVNLCAAGAQIKIQATTQSESKNAFHARPSTGRGGRDGRCKALAPQNSSSLRARYGRRSLYLCMRRRGILLLLLNYASIESLVSVDFHRSAAQHPEYAMIAGSALKILLTLASNGPDSSSPAGISIWQVAYLSIPIKPVASRLLNGVHQPVRYQT